MPLIYNGLFGARDCRLGEIADRGHLHTLDGEHLSKLAVAAAADPHESDAHEITRLKRDSHHGFALARWNGLNVGQGFVSTRTQLARRSFAYSGLARWQGNVGPFRRDQRQHLGAPQRHG